MLVASLSPSVAVERASAQWTPATVLATAAGGSGPDTSPQLAFTHSGTPVVWWGSDRWSQTTDGSWLRCRAGGAPLAFYGRDRIVLGARHGGAFRVALGRTSSCAVTRARTLVASRHPFDTALAANEHGDIAFAWQEYLGPRRGYHASVMLGHAGGKFGRPLALGRVGGSTPSVAVGPRGDVLVAWRGYGSHAVLMRYRPPGARHFESVHGFRVVAFYQRIATLVAPDGSAYVAAVGADGPSEGGSPALYELHAVAKPPNHSRFRTPQTLEDVAPGVLPVLPDTWAEPRLAITAGHVALAWTGWDGAHLVVKESAFDRGHFAAPATFSLPDTDVLLGGLALAPDGGALVTWGATRDGAVGAASRGPGAAFGTPEALLAPGPGALYWPPAVAASPSAPSALAVWVDLSPEPQKANLMIAARVLNGLAPAEAQPQPRQP